MFMGEHDEMSSVRDNQEVLRRMTSSTPVHCKIIPRRGHFLIGDGVDVQWFEQVIAMLEAYYSGSEVDLNKCLDIE